MAAVGCSLLGVSTFSQIETETVVPALSPLPVPPESAEWGPEGTKGLGTVLAPLPQVAVISSPENLCAAPGKSKFKLKPAQARGELLLTGLARIYNEFWPVAAAPSAPPSL